MSDDSASQETARLIRDTSEMLDLWGRAFDGNNRRHKTKLALNMIEELEVLYRRLYRSAEGHEPPRQHLNGVRQLQHAVSDLVNGRERSPLLTPLNSRGGRPKASTAKANAFMNALLAVELFCIAGDARTKAEDLVAERLVEKGWRKPGFGGHQLASFREGKRDLRSEAWRDTRAEFLGIEEEYRKFYRNEPKQARALAEFHFNEI